MGRGRRGKTPQRSRGRRNGGGRTSGGVHPPPLHRATPGAEAWEPAADAGAELVVLGAIGAAEGGLFVEKHKKVEADGHGGGVFEKRRVGEEESLAEDERDDADIHGIAHVAEQASDDKMLRGENRSGRAESLESEAREGVEKHGKAGEDQQYAGEANGGNAEERII